MVPLLKGIVLLAPGCWPMMYERKGELEGETVVTLGGFALRGVWIGSEGDPSELSDETEPERYLWWRPAAVLIEMGLECWILLVLLLSMTVSATGE